MFMSMIMIMFMCMTVFMARCIFGSIFGLHI